MMFRLKRGATSLRYRKLFFDWKSRPSFSIFISSSCSEQSESERPPSTGESSSSLETAPCAFTGTSLNRGPQKLSGIQILSNDRLDPTGGARLNEPGPRRVDDVEGYYACEIESGNPGMSCIEFVLLEQGSISFSSYLTDEPGFGADANVISGIPNLTSFYPFSATFKCWNLRVSLWASWVSRSSISEGASFCFFTGNSPLCIRL
mmetsp:Transcript_33356/g.51135  ORF Transcript_33356/g.51135 Transcript_33356/m.51135 type:complete len:205 (-) Transcript_33356:176-790(-)